MDVEKDEKRFGGVITMFVIMGIVIIIIYMIMSPSNNQQEQRQTSRRVELNCHRFNGGNLESTHSLVFSDGSLQTAHRLNRGDTLATNVTSSWSGFDISSARTALQSAGYSCD